RFNYWEGEQKYYPEQTFVYFAELLLFGIETIRNGIFGIINRMLEIVNDDWIITEWEIIDKRHRYQILYARLNEDDWIPHMLNKGWVDRGSFLYAFDTAMMLIERGIFAGNLPAGRQRRW